MSWHANKIWSSHHSASVQIGRITLVSLASLIGSVRTQKSAAPWSFTIGPRSGQLQREEWKISYMLEKSDNWSANSKIVEPTRNRPKPIMSSHCPQYIFWWVVTFCLSSLQQWHRNLCANFLDMQWTVFENKMCVRLVILQLRTFVILFFGHSFHSTPASRFCADQCQHSTFTLHSYNQS